MLFNLGSGVMMSIGCLMAALMIIKGGLYVRVVTKCIVTGLTLTTGNILIMFGLAHYLSYTWQYIGLGIIPIMLTTTIFFEFNMSEQESILNVIMLPVTFIGVMISCPMLWKFWGTLWSGRMVTGVLLVLLYYKFIQSKLRME